jgi:starch synthase
MIEDLPRDEVLRLQIQVPREEYRTLVARLRGEKGVRAPQSQSGKLITAQLDLSPDSATFAITQLGHHKLPQPVSIRIGSSTHQLLAQTISTELETVDDPSVTSRLRAIIEACPKPLSPALRIHPNDFELSPLARGSTTTPTAIRVLTTIAPTILLDLDDAPTLVVPDSASIVDDRSTHELVRTALSATLHTEVLVSGNAVQLRGSASLPTLSSPTRVTITAHWGSYDELAAPWQDEPVATFIFDDTDKAQAPRNITFEANLHAPIRGWYGATFYTCRNDSPEQLWIGRPWLDDLRFNITQDDHLTVSSEYERRTVLRNTAVTKARVFLSNPLEAPHVATWFEKTAPHLSLGAVVAAETNHSQATCELLDAALTSTVQSGAAHIAHRIRASYGVGEIVFATPEGPHAAAGGLAHVITGLPRELTEYGVPVTIVSPLYRYANGNKHPSAEDILQHGIMLGTERVVPRYATTVNVHLGPTHYSGTGWTKRPATTVPCKVYIAETGKLRLVLLANGSAFDRIYQPVFADEQLRRALIFSRAVLETIATQNLDIRPSALISNDWMTACIPSLLSLDSRYREVPWLRSAKSVHMIHNGGADYHGRLPLHFGNEDLWPLFSLAPEHYFGFQDPHRKEFLNLTMAAVQQACGGVITVSQPYAHDLVTSSGGDGLGRVLQHRRNSVYGVSNGINRSDIDGYFAARTGHSVAQLRDASTLIDAKATMRLDVQRRMGLKVDPNAQVVSFVGRIAEQKGLDLLSGFVDGTSHSTLEDLLVRHPTLQIIIAGPLTTGDRSANALHDATRYLAHRYTVRIATTFDYISHSTALEIISASTLFLMPSRFEPGGITQLEALAVGTPVVGRSVGGIAATIENYDPSTARGTGFLCHDYSATAFAHTTHWALATCADPQRYQSLVQQAIAAQHSWAHRAPTFLAVLQRIILGSDGAERLEFLDSLAPLHHAAQA